MSLFKKTFILFTLLYLLFFVKTWGSVTGNIYSHDDVVYYAQTASLANDFDTDIKNNLGPYSGIYLSISKQSGRMMIYQPLGPSLLYLAPYMVVKPLVHLISVIRAAGFNQYDPLFFVVLCFLTVVMFYAGGLFIRKALAFFVDTTVADIVTVFVLWGTILPVYVFRRPIFGVIPEFFVTSLLVYYLMRIQAARAVSVLQGILLGGILGFLLVTRWNDIYLFPLCFVFLCFKVYSQEGRLLREKLAIIVAFVLALAVFPIIQAIIWIKTYGSIKGFVLYYYQLHAQFISSQNTLSAYLKNIFHVFSGLDWGVLFTMPILFLGGLAFILDPKINISKNKKLCAVFFLLTFWACLHVVLQWKNTGEFYGYRFLISLLPFSALGFAALIKEPCAQYAKAIKWIILGFCLFNFFVLLPFEFTQQTTMLADTITPLGGRGWGNNAYFINAIQFYFKSGFKTLIALFSRGYLAAAIFGVLSLLGFNLSGFSPKAAAYFTLAGYRQYIAFLYSILVFFLLTCLGMVSYNKASKNIEKDNC